jgi:hypothetical protein
MDSLLPQLDPQTTQVLIQEIGIRYTEVEPTHTPNKPVEAWIYFDSSDYWLYVWANGAWRSQQLGVTQVTPPDPVQFGVWSFTIPGSTIVDTTTSHDFGFVPKQIEGALTIAGSGTIAFRGIWQDTQEQATSLVTDGKGNSSIPFLGSDASFYANNISISGTTMTIHYKQTGLSSATVYLWAIGN